MRVCVGGEGVRVCVGGEGVRVCVCIGSHCVYVYNYN